MTIRGRVAAVLNAREVAFNVGASSDVEVGMRFLVLDKAGLVLRNPDNQDELGTIDVPKIQMEVIRVEDHYAVARTLSKRENVGGQGFGSDMMRLYGPSKWVTRHETLKKSDANYEPLDESNAIVGVGDTVVQVIEDHTPRSNEEGEEAVQ